MDDLMGIKLKIILPRIYTDLENTDPLILGR